MSIVKVLHFGQIQIMVVFYILAVPVMDFFADNTQKDNDLKNLISLIDEIKNEPNVR